MNAKLQIRIGIAAAAFWATLMVFNEISGWISRGFDIAYVIKIVLELGISGFYIFAIIAKNLKVAWWGYINWCLWSLMGLAVSYIFLMVHMFVAVSQIWLLTIALAWLLWIGVNGVKRYKLEQECLSETEAIVAEETGA